MSWMKKVLLQYLRGKITLLGVYDLLEDLKILQNTFS